MSLKSFFSWFTQLQTLATFVITFLVVSLVIVTTQAIMVTYNQVSGQLAQDQYRRLALAAAERLSNSMENSMLGLTTLAGQVEMQSGEPTLQEATLDRGAALISNFTNRDAGIIILDEQGFVSVTRPFRPDLIGKNFSEEPYFQEARDLRTNVYANVLPEPGTKKNVIVLATPIINREDEFVGIIAGRFYIDFRGLNRQIEGVSLSNDADIYVVDRNGRLIYHPYQPLIGQEFGHEVAVNRLRQGELTGTVSESNNQEDPRVEGFAIVPITNWGVVIGGPLSQAVDPVNEVLQPASRVLVIGLVFIAFVVSLGVYRVTNPIRNLVTQIRHVTKGDYDAQVELSRIKEIRELGEASNEMVEQIRRYRAGTRQYIAGVTRSQEEERKRIARDLHDDTVQTLIAIGQRVDLVKAVLGTGDSDLARERLGDLRQLVNGAIDNVRQFSRDLRPLALEDLGLVSALQYLVNQLGQQSDIVTDLEIIGEPEGLPSDMEVTIYRILQESLNNVKKHAQATEVNVTVIFTRQEIELTVQDNGRGFEVPESITDFASQGSLGVMGLQERAQLFGGHITLESVANVGTTITLVMPRQVSLSPFEIYHLPYLQGSKVAAGDSLSGSEDG